MTKKIIGVLLCLSIVIGLCACAAEAPVDIPTPEITTTTPPPTEATTEATTVPTTEPLTIKIKVPQVHIAIDETQKVSASLSREGSGTLEDIKWTSSNANIATVDENGTITAKAIGKSKITGAIGDIVSNDVEVSVEKLVTGATMDQEQITINARDSADIGAGPIPLDATDTSLHWKNDDPRVAEIRGNRVYGIVAGTCTMSVYNNREEKLGNIFITVNPAPPKPSKNPAYQNLLVEFTTKYDASNTNRTTNLEIASEAITNTCLEPGEQFSFNNIVGPRTKAKGYKEAIVFNGGKEEKGLAGGICQVSSTLFNAALMSNFQIDERKCHSLKVKYVKLGRDAAISGTYQDLKFTNTLDVAVCIEMECGGGLLTTRVYTYGTDSYALPKIEITSEASGHNATVYRYADSVLNYSAGSTYGN